MSAHIVAGSDAWTKKSSFKNILESYTDVPGLEQNNQFFNIGPNRLKLHLSSIRVKWLNEIQ
jgi:hypothetical protein